MEQIEQRLIGEEFAGDASPSDSRVREEWVDFEESPPLPFPFPHRDLDRNVNHADAYSHRDQLRETENEGSPVAGNESCSCIIVALTFCVFVAMSLLFGVYAPEIVRLGPNSSILISPNHLFVDSIKVIDLETHEGLTLYGFYKRPPLDVIFSWSDSHKIALPPSTHKEWKFFLNEGSQVNISYSVNSRSSSSLVLIIAEGNGDLDAWFSDPLYPNTTLSWNIILGNGSLQKRMPKSSSYYIAVGNLVSELVEVQLNIRIKALLYDTTEAYYQCTLFHSQCVFKLFPSDSAAVLTSPDKKSGMTNRDWCIKISYGTRWITYIVGLGGMTILVLLINHMLDRFRGTNENESNGDGGVLGSQRTSLVLQKDDDPSSLGSSYASISEDEDYREDAHAHDGKPVKDDKRICAICFDALRNCFFLPCGHCVSCFECGTRIVEASGTCPICRRPTKKVRKIYTV